MKKTNFEERLQIIAQEALDFLKSNVKKGKTIIFFTEKQREENEDAFYELPIASKVTKHGFYDEFSITSVTKKGDDLIFNGVCRGEGDDCDEITLNDISNTNLCAIADLVAEKLS